MPSLVSVYHHYLVGNPNDAFDNVVTENFLSSIRCVYIARGQLLVGVEAENARHGTDEQVLDEEALVLSVDFTLSSSDPDIEQKQGAKPDQF